MRGAVALICCLGVCILVFFSYASRNKSKELIHNELRPVKLTSAIKNFSVCDNLFWLHAPKTGSTLFMAIQHICCPSEYEKFVNGISLSDIQLSEQLPARNRTLEYKSEHGSIYFVRNKSRFKCKHRINIDHNPLPLNKLAREDAQRLSLNIDAHIMHARRRSPSMTTIGMFRKPLARVISSFLDGMHHEGLNESVYRRWYNEEILHRNHLRGSEHGSNVTLRSAGITVDEAYVGMAQHYANLPSMIGCQVKLLNGWECSSVGKLFPISNTSKTEFVYDPSTPINHTAIDVAVTNLRRFKFVGIFERFNDSVALLHRVMDVGTVPSIVELYPQRRTNSQVSKVLASRIVVQDPYDSALYAEATKLFTQQWERYHM